MVPSNVYKPLDWFYLFFWHGATKIFFFSTKLKMVTGHGWSILSENALQTKLMAHVRSRILSTHENFARIFFASKSETMPRAQQKSKAGATEKRLKKKKKITVC